MGRRTPTATTQAVLDPTESEPAGGGNAEGSSVSTAHTEKSEAPVHGDDGARAAGKGRRGGLDVSRLRTLGLVLAIILVSLFFQSQNSAFLSSRNMLSLLRAMSSLAIIAFAQMMVIIKGELDLSVGSVYLLSSTAFAVLWLGGGALDLTVPMAVALILALGVGALAGAINGFFTTVARIPSFIATLGMLSMAQGAALLLSRAQNFSPDYNVPLPSEASLTFFRALGSTTLPLGIPIQVAWLALFFGLFWFLRHRTIYGFRSLAIGGNEEAARIARLPITRYKMIAFVLSALMASVAGLLDFSYTGSVGPSAGAALTFPVFAAVVIGGTRLTGGRGTAFGTLMGALLLSVLNNGLAVLGVGAFVQLVFVGAVTIAAVTLDQVSARAGTSGRGRTAVGSAA